MSVTLVGLKACDTCKAARKWLDARGIDYSYVDVRADGLDARSLASWMNAHGDWQPFVNRRGTTWRQLPDKDKENVDRARAIALIASNPTLMKRPVIVMGTGERITVTVGFGKAQQEAILTAAG